jgi:hypothetical protein
MSPPKVVESELRAHLRMVDQHPARPGRPTLTSQVLARPLGVHMPSVAGRPVISTQRPGVPIRGSQGTAPARQPMSSTDRTPVASSSSGCGCSSRTPPRELASPQQELVDDTSLPLADQVDPGVDVDGSSTPVNVGGHSSPLGQALERLAARLSTAP